VINDEQEQLEVAKMLNGLSMTFLYYVPFYLSVCRYVCMFDKITQKQLIIV